MATKRVSRRAKVQVPLPPATVWQAMNEPIAYATPEFATNLFAIAILLLGLAWLQPYFGSTNHLGNHGIVAGAQTINYEISTPSWYIGLASTGQDFKEFSEEAIVQPFAAAATQILDISEPVQNTVKFYHPGVTAVKDAWLELMADPQL